jgi:Arc/MetJ family transcription regulator
MWCIVFHMGRTNIEIDDELVHRVMVMFNLTTKREAVDLALRRLALPPMSKEEALTMFGSMPDFEVPQDRIDHDWHDDSSS